MDIWQGDITPKVDRRNLTLVLISCKSTETCLGLSKLEAIHGIRGLSLFTKFNIPCDTSQSVSKADLNKLSIQTPTEVH